MGAGTGHIGWRYRMTKSFREFENTHGAKHRHRARSARGDTPRHCWRVERAQPPSNSYLGVELISAHPQHSSKLGAQPSHTLCMIGITLFVTHKINENPVSDLYHFNKTVKFGLVLGFCWMVLMNYLTKKQVEMLRKLQHFSNSISISEKWRYASVSLSFSSSCGWVIFQEVCRILYRP